MRLLRSGGRLAVVEIDGESTEDEMRAFARHSLVPIGFKEAYVRFAMRTVVSVAPDWSSFRASFAGLPLTSLELSKLSGLPFLLAFATVV